MKNVQAILHIVTVKWLSTTSRSYQQK